MNAEIGGSIVSTTFHPGRAEDGAVWAALIVVVGTLQRWAERARQRHDLSQLSEWELNDIGASPVAAAKEAAKPFWHA